MNAQLLSQAGVEIPNIPEKLFFTIREVSDLCQVEPHVLRYWETEFSQLRPVKKSGNRRFYRQKDVYTVSHIKHLLYVQNYTIKGAKKCLLQQPGNNVAAPADLATSLRNAREELQAIRSLLDT